MRNYPIIPSQCYTVKAQQALQRTIGWAINNKKIS